MGIESNHRPRLPKVIARLKSIGQRYNLVDTLRKFNYALTKIRAAAIHPLRREGDKLPGDKMNGDAILIPIFKPVQRFLMWSSLYSGTWILNG